jgi:hypothetical protein
VARIIGFLAAIGIVLSALPAAAANRIEWRLENPFRLFKNPEDTEMHRQALLALAGEEKRVPILAVERRLEERFGGRGWAEEVFNHTCYNQEGDRYDACPDYILPKSHRVVVSLVQQKRIWD